MTQFLRFDPCSRSRIKSDKCIQLNMCIIGHNAIIQMPKFNPYLWIREFPAVYRL